MRRIKKRADFGGIFTSAIAPVINGIGGVLDSTLSKQDVNQVKTEDSNAETDNTVAMRYGGNARPKCWLGGAIGAATSLASGLIGGAANRKAARQAAALKNRQTMIQDIQGRDKQLNALYSTYLNNNNNEEDLVYRKGGTATQHPRRRMFDRGSKYNFANFANRLERDVNESDNIRVAGGRKVVNARNRQYRKDNTVINKVINYIDKSDRAFQIKRKGTLTAQQYRNSKAAQTFGRYDRVNYNGKTYYVPQVQGGIAPTVGISNAEKVASFYNRLDKAKRVFSGVPSINNLRRKLNLPSLETIINDGRNNFKGISNTERSFRPNPVMPKGYRVTGLKGTQSPKEVGEGLYNYLTKRTAIVPDRGNVKPFPINSNSTYNTIRPKLYNTRTSPVYRTDNNPAYEGRIPFMSVGDRIRVGADKVNLAVKPVVQKLSNLNNKGIEWNNALRAYSRKHPYATQAIISTLGTSVLLPAYDAAKNYIQSNNTPNNSNKNIVAKMPINRFKTQPKRVNNDTVKVAKQTTNDFIIIKDKVQPGEVVHRDSIYRTNDGESYVKVGDKTGNTWVNIKNVPANTPAVSNNKTTDSRNLGKSQIQQTKAAAETIQRRGRTKSRVAANRTNNNSNNFRQNINFEPLDDTVNGYSQVEDIQGRSYDEYKADVDAEAEARRQEVVNDLLSNYNYEDRNTTDEMRYGGKARSKRRVPIKITDGGVAQKIGNNTFLLRGGSHEQVNPSGQTGIGIKVGNNEIEAEGGEVAQRVGNALRIFSAQPMINGVSPAQAVEAGANKNRIFAIQEALKRKGYKCGGRIKFAPGGKVNPIFNYINRAGIEDLQNSNTGISSGTYNNGNLSLGQSENLIFPKGFVNHDFNNIGSRQTNNNNAPVDNWWNRNGMSVNSSDWIGLGTDLVGSLTLGALNANNYKNLKYDYKLPNYVDETPVAFDTTYHNDAQRATVERNRLNAQKIIANNTSSANTALQRMQQSNVDAMMETNKLWDEKANKEAELRNTAAQNEQQVRARNAAARNQYYQNVAEIENKRIDAENANKLAHSNAWATSLQGLQGAANNFLSSTRQRYEDENALMATIAAGDAATPYRMMAFGTQFGPRIINAIRAMNNIESMKGPGAAPVRSNYSNDADYSAARSKWETAMRNYEYWKQRDRFLSHYDRKGRLIRRR